jgi:ElaA protein
MTGYTIKHFNDLSVNELHEIMALRQTVFIVEQNCPYLDADFKDLQSYHLFLRNEEGRMVAYSRLVPEGISYPDFTSIGRVVVHPEIRRTGTGKQLMVESISACVSCFGNKSIKISAQSYLRDFYASFGFEQISEPYMEDDIPHIAMILEIAENQPVR